MPTTNQYKMQYGCNSRTKNPSHILEEAAAGVCPAAAPIWLSRRPETPSRAAIARGGWSSSWRPASCFLGSNFFGRSRRRSSSGRRATWRAGHLLGPHNRHQHPDHSCHAWQYSFARKGFPKKNGKRRCCTRQRLVPSKA